MPPCRAKRSSTAGRAFMPGTVKPMRIVTEAEARRLVDASDAFAVVERGFADVARGDAILLPPTAGPETDPATRCGAKAAKHSRASRMDRIGQQVTHLGAPGTGN